MNKPKRPLRSTLAELAAAFADAVIAAARESIFELAAVAPVSPDRPRAQPRRERPRVARAQAPAKRTRPARVASEPPASPASDLLITDPQALLTALETAGPSAPSTGWEAASQEPAPREREEPDILRSVSAAPAVAPLSAFAAFAPREGEVIVRRSAGGVVLRRRRA